MHFMRYKKGEVRKNWCLKKIGVNETSASKKCELSQYWFFKDIRFQFKENIFDRYHDLLTMTYSLKNIAILSARGVTFR